MFISLVNITDPLNSAHQHSLDGQIFAFVASEDWHLSSNKKVTIYKVSGHNPSSRSKVAPLTLET